MVIAHCGKIFDLINGGMTIYTTFIIIWLQTRGSESMARVKKMWPNSKGMQKRKMYSKIFIKKNVNCIIYNYPAIVSTRLKEQIFWLVKLFFLYNYKLKVFKMTSILTYYFSNVTKIRRFYKLIKLNSVSIPPVLQHYNLHGVIYKIKTKV